MIHIDVAFTNERGACSILDVMVHHIKRDKIPLFISFFRDHVLNRFNDHRETINITEILYDFVLQFYIMLLAPILETECNNVIEQLLPLPLQRERAEGEEEELSNLSESIDLNLCLNENIVQQANVDVDEMFRTWFQEGAELIFVFMYNRSGGDDLNSGNGENEYDYIYLSSDGVEQQLLEAFEKAGVLIE